MDEGKIYNWSAGTQSLTLIGTGRNEQIHIYFFMESENAEDFHFRRARNVDTKTFLLGFAKLCKVDVNMKMGVGNVKDVLSDKECEKAENRYMEA